MPDNRLTRKIQTRITKDWHEHFPELAIYKPRWMLRRVGPLLQGVLLERDSSNDSYLPMVHLHNLAREWSSITISPSIALLTIRTSARDKITVRSHEKRYLEAISRLKEQSVIPCRGELTLSEALTIYRKCMTWPIGQPQTSFFEGMASCCSWVSDEKQAVRILEERWEQLQNQPKNMFAKPLREPKEWFDWARETFASETVVRATVAKEVVAHSLQELPFNDLISD